MDISGLSVSEFIKKYGIPERTAMNWKKGLKFNKVTEALFKVIIKSYENDPPHQNVRICPGCGTLKYIEEFSIVRRDLKSRRTYCNQCHSKNNSEIQKKLKQKHTHPVFRDKEFRTCTKCNKTKKSNLFVSSSSVRKDGTRGHTNVCIECHRKICKDYYNKGKRSGD